MMNPMHTLGMPAAAPQAPQAAAPGAAGEITPEMLAQIMAGQEAQAALSPLEKQLALAEQMRGFQMPGGRSAGQVYQAANPLEFLGAMMSGIAGEREYGKLSEQAEALRKTVGTGKGAQQQADLIADAQKAALNEYYKTTRLSQMDTAENRKEQQRLDALKRHEDKMALAQQKWNTLSAKDKRKFANTDRAWNELSAKQKEDIAFKQQQFEFQKKVKEKQWTQAAEKHQLNVEEFKLDQRKFELKQEQIRKEQAKPFAGLETHQQKRVDNARGMISQMAKINENARQFTQADINFLNEIGTDAAIATLAPGGFEAWIESKRQKTTSERVRKYLTQVRSLAASMRHEIAGSALTANEQQLVRAFLPDTPGVSLNDQLQRLDDTAEMIMADVRPLKHAMTNKDVDMFGGLGYQPNTEFRKKLDRPGGTGDLGADVAEGVDTLLGTAKEAYQGSDAEKTIQQKAKDLKRLRELQLKMQGGN